MNPESHPCQRATPRRSYRRLLKYVRPYVGRLAAGGLCGMLFAGSFVSLLPALRELLGNTFSADESLPGEVTFISVVFIAIVAVGAVGLFLSGYLLQWVGQRVVADLRSDVFRHLQDLSVGYYDQSKTGDMIARTLSDAQLIQFAVSNVLTELVREPFVLVGVLAYLFYEDWGLALISLVVFPCFVVPVIVLGRNVRKAGRQAQQILSDLTSVMTESLSGVRIVKAFGQERRERDSFDRHCEGFFRKTMRVARARALSEPIARSLAGLCFVGMLFYAKSRNMNWEGFLTFGLALVMLYEPVKKLSRIHVSIQHSASGADRLFDLLDTPVAIVDRPDAIPLDRPVESIEFRGVTFGYGATPVLRNLNLFVTAGQSVAIVGASGSGKTTLISLLLRFFDVQQGALLVNGRDIRDYRIASVRARIGLVTQETVLFNDTVASNIAYGLPDAPRARIEEAARRAHAHEFIQALPEGYDSGVGERATRLSGGQRQRLAIARAILRNPEILILDEATSALDAESERSVQLALDEAVKGRTVLAIAHRLSTIRACDRIVVLSAGEIVESGAHDELIARNGVYKRLHDLQFSV